MKANYLTHAYRRNRLCRKTFRLVTDLIVLLSTVVIVIVIILSDSFLSFAQVMEVTDASDTIMLNVDRQNAQKSIITEKKSITKSSMSYTLDITDDIILTETADTADVKSSKSVTADYINFVTEDEVFESDTVNTAELEQIDELELAVVEETVITATTNQTESAYIYSELEELWPDDYCYYRGEILTADLGKVIGPSGLESYYNLDMSGVIDIMIDEGFDYQYWVREDGVKMYGDYIMVAADLSIRPRGTIVKTTLGLGIVCDTGYFIYDNSEQLDIAVTW